MKLFSIIFLSFILSACGGGSSSSKNDNSEAETETETETIGFFTVYGTGEVYEHSSDTPYNLTITGMNHLISTKENQQINELTVDGSNNSLYVGEGSTIEFIDITGSDNSVSVPDGSFTEFRVTGPGNQLIKY